MKVALCLSGQPRVIEDAFETQKEFIIKNNVDTFLHLWWENSYQNKVIRYHSYERYPQDDLSLMVKNLYNPLSYEIQDHIKFSQKFCENFNYNTWGLDKPRKFYQIFTPLAIYSLLSQSYSISRSTKLCLDNDNNYDISIRMRFDCLLTKDLGSILENLKPEKNKIYFQSSMSGGHKYAGEDPNNPCDWFYCGLPEEVNRFSEMWHKSLTQLLKNGIIHNKEILRKVAEISNLELVLIDFGVLIYRQVFSTSTKDLNYHLNYEHYLETFDSNECKILNHDLWPHWVDKVDFENYKNIY